ncbi:MAG: DUF433 domain-containing protein [Gemmataceae bacterium]|nr:DUF433 domain-containing protein [Gemmataceae bacterium]
MSDQTRDLLASFDALSPADRYEVTAEILRRAEDYGPLTDEALTELAGQLAARYDAEEAVGRPTGLGHGGIDYTKILTVEPDKRSGQVCIRGIRMTVLDVLEYLGGGMTVDEVLEDFPNLTREDIQACLAYAADTLRRLRDSGRR